MVDASGNFVSSAGGLVSSYDFETTADAEAPTSTVYLNAVSVWAFVKDKTTAPQPTKARLAFGNVFCFEDDGGLGEVARLAGGGPEADGGRESRVGPEEGSGQQAHRRFGGLAVQPGEPAF